MKLVFSILLIAATGLTAYANNVFRINRPTEVNVSLSGGYFANGFDSNDKIQITVEGVFSNTCFKVGPTKINVNQESKVIEVTQSAYRYDGACLMVIVEYNQTVDVGILDVGNYTVRDTSTGDTLGTLNVVKAPRPESDDYLYAPVSDAFVARTDEGLKQLVLSGIFTNSCLKFKEIRVINSPSNVLVVQPITEKKDRTDCVDGSFPFYKTEQLSNNLPSGKYLLHVRSMNGQAVNKVVPIY